MTEQENIQELRNYFVYEIRRPLETNDPRKYIGVSHHGKKYGPKVRFRGHKKSKYPIGHFIRKYPDAQMYIMHENLTREEAYRIEKQLVPLLSSDRRKLNLINATQGGTNAVIPAGEDNPCSKPYKFLSPDGVLFEGKNIDYFCKQNNLNFSSIMNLVRKKVYQYKGWTIPGHERPKKEEIEYVLLSPNNEKIITTNIIQLAKENNLNPDRFRLMAIGTRQSYKGWRLDTPINQTPKYWWKFLSPEGDEVYTEDLRGFCKTNNLNINSTKSLIKGTVKCSKGWRYIDSNKRRRNIWRFISPKGELAIINDLKLFCKENNLSYELMRYVSLNRVKNHKGWKPVEPTLE